MIITSRLQEFGANYKLTTTHAKETIIRLR
jgi:hypothetical protein